MGVSKFFIPKDTRFELPGPCIGLGSKRNMILIQRTSKQCSFADSGREVITRRPMWTCDLNAPGIILGSVP